jgi:hypothetical protein
MSGAGRHCAEEAVRAKLAEVLRGDAGVMGAVHQIYERKMPRMTPPYVLIGLAEGREWGTKDREGREVVAALTIMGGKSDGRAVVDDVTRLASGVRGLAGGWEICSARVIRMRWLPLDDGGWQAQIQLRCRCLVAGA